MKFEKPSLDESKELVQRLRDKTVAEIIGILGPPAQETGARKEERLYDEVPAVIEISRTLTFYDVGPTIHRLRIVELDDGQCEFHMSGRETPDEPSA